MAGKGCGKSSEMKGGKGDGPGKGCGKPSEMKGGKGDGPGKGTKGAKGGGKGWKGGDDADMLQAAIDYRVIPGGIKGTLKLGGWDLGERAAGLLRSLPKAIARGRKIKVLGIELHKNKLPPSVIPVLCSVLAEIRAQELIPVDILVLFDNQLDDDAAKILARDWLKAQAVWSENHDQEGLARELHLSHNRIGVEGALAIIHTAQLFYPRSAGKSRIPLWLRLEKNPLSPLDLVKRSQSEVCVITERKEGSCGIHGCFKEHVPPVHLTFYDLQLPIVDSGGAKKTPVKAVPSSPSRPSPKPRTAPTPSPKKPAEQPAINLANFINLSQHRALVRLADKSLVDRKLTPYLPSLVKFLPQGIRVLTIDLHRNALGGEFIHQLCKTLEELREVRSIVVDVMKLYDNCIDDDGVVELARHWLAPQAKWCAENPSSAYAVEIHLSHNRVGRAGFEALVEAAKGHYPINGTPLWLRVENNTIPTHELPPEVLSQLCVPKEAECSAKRCAKNPPPPVHVAHFHSQYRPVSDIGKEGSEIVLVLDTNVILEMLLLAASPPILSWAALLDSQLLDKLAPKLCLVVLDTTLMELEGLKNNPSMRQPINWFLGGGGEQRGVVSTLVESGLGLHIERMKAEERVLRDPSRRHCAASKRDADGLVVDCTSLIASDLNSGHVALVTDDSSMRRRAGEAGVPTVGGSVLQKVLLSTMADLSAGHDVTRGELWMSLVPVQGDQDEAASDAPKAPPPPGPNQLLAQAAEVLKALIDKHRGSAEIPPKEEKQEQPTDVDGLAARLEGVQLENDKKPSPEEDLIGRATEVHREITAYFQGQHLLHRMAT